MPGLLAYFRHHLRFYGAIAAGLAALGLGLALDWPAPPLLGGDVFFLTFLLLCVFVMREPADRFAARANSVDEGILVVVLLTLASMAFFCVAVFTALNDKHGATAPLVLALAGAPLGWFVFHTVMAFHYANLYYYDDPETTADDVRDLEFPGCAMPGPWDFLYFSFVVGMTAQVSDVQIKTTAMRRAALGHGVASFFFNTVFIAMAVNAAVAMAS